ncbi:MAG: beta-ketoacyl-[acyl-carrier-protein] synthase II [Sorangium cellulosum]|nr:MAG: beta-ketoacyl-[acyl-carrier-protein] synthase II [Sorangium cellulosum]
MNDRIVITGLGAVTPCGIGVDDSWKNVVAGHSGIGPIASFDATSFAVQIAGEVKDWEPLRFVCKKKKRELGRFAQFAVGAAAMASEDAQLELTDEERDCAACVLGVGMGGLEAIEQVSEVLRNKAPSKVSPYAILNIANNMAAGQIAMHLDLRGPSYVTAAACASGANALADAVMLLRSGRASVVLAGGAEATIRPVCVAGFQAMHALSRRNSEPERASRPFDRDRDGFVLAEGAAMLVLEPYSRAKKRGANIYAEVSGFGFSTDPYHPVKPQPGGRGAIDSMRRALKDAKVEPAAVDYINAHGTSTPQGDAEECQAIHTVFGERAAHNQLWVSSTKSVTGHLLGAAGAVEAAFTALACKHGVVPPTMNVQQLDPVCAVDVVPNQARQRAIRHAISNSFGFGGANVSLLFSQVN